MTSCPDHLRRDDVFAGSQMPPDREARDERPRWRRALRMAWLLATFIALAFAIWRRWPDVRGAFATLDLTRILVSAGFAAIGVGLSGEVWRRLLTGLGHRLPLRGTARIFFVGQLGKYLPGSLWPVLAQMELGRDFGVAPRTSVAAVASFLWVHIVTGGSIAAITLAWLGVVPAWVGLAGTALGALLWAPLMRKTLMLAMRITRRPPLERYPSQRTVVSATGWAAAMWGCYGLHLAWLVPAGSGPDFFGSTGTFAASWILGFVFIIAPAGAGARETVLVAILTRWLPLGVALAITVTSRILMTIADAAWGAVGSLASGRAHGTVRPDRDDVGH